MASLRTFLGFNDNTDIALVMPGEVPEIMINFDEVYSRSLENSSFYLDRELALLYAKQEVEKAKSGNGLQADLFATLGFTQKGSDLGAAYKSPIDQEIVGLRLTLPILDWGLGKGKVKLALSREEVAKAQVEQAMIQNRQDILIKVMRFNKQNVQCRTSAEADSIARISYNISQERFRNGTISILELNDAQTRKDNAVQRYISDLGSYWKYYYDIRKVSLYDYLTGKEISVNFESLTGN
jgi:outer membrane protein TolC